MLEGGLTPSVALLSYLKTCPMILEKGSDLQIFCMIRPRGGDFLYSKEELEIMKGEIKVWYEV